MEIVLEIVNSTSGASVSNWVKSWVSQKFPIASNESALEMLLSLFSAIPSPFWWLHVTSTNDNRCLRIGFVNKENRKVSPPIGLSKCGVKIIARRISLFCKTNPRLAQQYLTGFPYCYTMFGGKFVFNCFWTNNMFNMNGNPSFLEVGYVSRIVSQNCHSKKTSICIATAPLTDHT